MRKGRHRNKNPKKKKEKFIGSQSFKQFLGRVLPIGIPLLCFGFFFFFLSKSAFQFLTHSPYFAVETVEASSSIRDFTFRDTHLMGSLLDRNIFSVDLQTLEAEVSRKHPELLAVSVSREFPNRIRLDVTPRLPVAEIQGGEHFLVDEEGVILPETHRLHREKLPIIVGTRKRLDQNDIGTWVRSRALNEALRFLSSLHQFPELERHVHTIDVSDDDDLFFFTPEGLEVKVGQGDYTEKLKLFDRTRVSLGKRIDEIKYIDLRFDEIVVGSR